MIESICILWIFFCLIGPFLYSYYTNRTNYKHYTLDNFEKLVKLLNMAFIVIILVNIISTIILQFYFNFHGKEILQGTLILLALSKIMIIRYHHKINHLEYDYVLRKETMKYLKSIILTTDSEHNWKETRDHFDAINTGKEQFDFETLFFFIIVEKYNAMGGIPIYNSPPPFLTLHPYYPEFKKRVEEIDIIPILKKLRERDGSTKMVDELIEAWELKNGNPI